jgi:hypothetical protein
MSSPSLAFQPSTRYETSAREQRRHQRYPIALDAEFHLLDRGQSARLRAAKTVNIGTGGLLLECNDSLPPGRRIEVSIQWPFLLDGLCPLKLVIRGRIVRVRGPVVAIETSHHEFRTAARVVRS